MFSLLTMGVFEMASQKKIRLPKGFESLETSQNESQIRQKCLAKRRSKRCRSLAASLAACGGDGGPCGSGACPVCFRANRRKIIPETIKLHGQYPALKAVTLIFYEEAMTSKEFMAWDVRPLIVKLRKKFGRCGVRGPVIGSFDIDYHADTELWLPHFHLLISSDEAGLKALRRYMKRPKNMVRDGVKNRPMLVQGINDPAKQAGYLYKSYWSQIACYSKNGKRRTAKRRLKKNQHALSLLKLDQLGLQGGLFLYGLRYSGGKLRVMGQCHRGRQ